MRILFLLISVIFCWALNLPLTKIGLEYMPPVWLTVCRFVVGALAVFIFLALQKRVRLPKRKDLPFICSIGILQMGVFQILLSCGLLFVAAGRASILVYSTPLWVMPFAILIFGEKLTFNKLTGFLLGMAGIAVLFSPLSFNWHDPKILWGNGMLLLASICWAMVMLHTRYGHWHSEPLELLPWQLLLSILPPLILAPIIEPPHLIHWSKTLIAIISYSGLLATAFGYFASIAVSRALPVITYSLALLAVPALSLIFADLLLGEKLTISNLIALILIIGGLSFIVLDHNKNRSR